MLVVEDDAETREALAEVLSAAAFNVTTAANGRRALEALEKSEELCAVVLDLRLPVMDGWEFLAALSAERRARLKVIAVSASTQELQRAMSHPHVHYVVAKPFDVDALLNTVEKACA